MRAAVLAAAMLAMITSADAKARVRCTSGRTVVQDGPLRLFGIGEPNRYGPVRATLYACLGGVPRPTAVGSESTRLVAFDGSRYLATLDASTGGEGSGDSTYLVMDLRRHRLVTYANAVWDADAFFGNALHPFRVTTAGALVRDDYGIQVIRRGSKGDDRLIPAVGQGDEIAYVGDTVYWSDDAAARSTVIGTPAARPENRIYDLQLFNAAGLLSRRRGGCAAMPGITIAASPHVRVVARNGRRFACATGKAWRHALGPRAGATGELRIVHDRWLLSRRAAGAIVIDARNGAVVTRVSGAITGSTLAGDGTFAWIEPGGRLVAKTPRATTPTVLAEATDAPAKLASSNRTIYWTAGGAPARWAR
jgi:hypothetical protein